MSCTRHLVEIDGLVRQRRDCRVAGRSSAWQSVHRWHRTAASAGIDVPARPTVDGVGGARAACMNFRWRSTRHAVVARGSSCYWDGWHADSLASRRVPWKQLVADSISTLRPPANINNDLFCAFHRSGQWFRRCPRLFVCPLTVRPATAKFARPRMPIVLFVAPSVVMFATIAESNCSMRPRPRPAGILKMTRYWPVAAQSGWECAPQRPAHAVIEQRVNPAIRSAVGFRQI